MGLEEYVAAKQSWYVSSNAEATSAIKSGGGNVYSILVSNVSASTRYVWVFDNTAASGTKLLSPVQVAAGGIAAFDVPRGRPFTTGCMVASSSTHATFTGAGSDFIVTAEYI